MEFITVFPATTALIAANVIASVIAFSLPDFYEQNVFHIRSILKKQEWHRVVTSGFLHVNGLHLFLNMYVLFIFGPYLEQGLGTLGFLIVYFAALLGGSVWMLLDKREVADYRAAGASGAISGVLLGFCLFAPFAMLLLFFVIPMPAIGFAVGFIALSLYLSGRDNTMVAHGAHLGGALAGLVTTILVRPSVLVDFIGEVRSVLGA